MTDPPRDRPHSLDFIPAIMSSAADTTSPSLMDLLDKPMLWLSSVTAEAQDTTTDAPLPWLTGADGRMEEVAVEEEADTPTTTTPYAEGGEGGEWSRDSILDSGTQADIDRLVRESGGLPPPPSRPPSPDYMFMPLQLDPKAKRQADGLRLLMRNQHLKYQPVDDYRRKRKSSKSTPHCSVCRGKTCHKKWMASELPSGKLTLRYPSDHCPVEDRCVRLFCREGHRTMTIPVEDVGQVITLLQHCVDRVLPTTSASATASTSAT